MVLRFRYGRWRSIDVEVRDVRAGWRAARREVKDRLAQTMDPGLSYRGRRAWLALDSCKLKLVRRLD